VQQQRVRTLPGLALVFTGLAVAGIIALLLIPGGSGTKRKAAPPPPSAGPARIAVWLTDFRIVPYQSTVAAGKVTFVATNGGKVPHEMVVVRTDSRPRDLLKGAKASEAGSVGEIGEFKAGGTARVTLDLKPGHYLLLCNLPGHFKAGMFKNFIVK
jgi:hypothetical protein